MYSFPYGAHGVAYFERGRRGVRTGGCSPSESSGRVIRDRDRVRIGLRVTSSLFRPRFKNEGSVMSNFD